MAKEITVVLTSLSMKLIISILLAAALLFSGYPSQAQDTLPRFTVKNVNGKVILSWVNQFPVVRQLSIQRSADSLKGFRTILTLPDPSSVTNGFLDNNAPDTGSFYKLYILLDSGKYIFSKSQRPHKAEPPSVVRKEESSPASAVSGSTDRNSGNAISSTTAASGTAGADTKGAQPAGELSSQQYRPELTQIANRRRSDGLRTDTVVMVRPETFTPSGFVYTNPLGNITVVVPVDKRGLYTIKFFDDNGDEIFQIANIKEHIFSIDKSNFMRSGWYKFELYENNVLKEKNKVLVPKDSSIR